jgi:alpha-beta hydrolase superfamily lysophospholipase
VLLVAGEADPVGNYGKGVRRVYHMLRTAGVRDVTCRLWKGGRHEMHNELDRDDFLHYVLAWVEKRI